jgi:cell division protein FtsB
MRKHFLLLLTVLMLSGVFLIPAEGQAQESQDVEALKKEVESLRSEVEKLKTKNDEYNFLKEQIKEFKDSADKDMDDYRAFVEGEWDKFLTLLEYVGVIVVIFIGASWWELRREIKKVKEKAIADFKNRIIEELDKVRNKETEKFEKEFAKWQSEAKVKLDYLNKMIDKEQ